MKHFPLMGKERQRLVCNQTGAQLNLEEVAVEKDFWVCWTLDKLFRLPQWGDNITFKGGTSLSKGWKLIARFSEDIDIVIDRDALGFGGKTKPETAPSKKQTKKRLGALRDACRQCVAESILPLLKAALSADIPTGKVWDLIIDKLDPDNQTLLFNYPSVFDEQAKYLKRTVKIEMGARSDTEPVESIKIRPYISEVFPYLLSSPEVEVRAVSPVRTFWEKAMLLHEESYRPNADNRFKTYMARHYYDLYQLIRAGIAEKAAADLELFKRIKEHRMIFFRYTWLDYDSVKPSTLRLVPTETQMPNWRTDYTNMQQELFFGEIPTFDEIIDKVRRFQEEFNEKNL